MEEEIAPSPKDPELLAQRLHNNTAASPHGRRRRHRCGREDVNEAGLRRSPATVQLPNQSMVEENAKAMGRQSGDMKSWISSASWSAAIAIATNWKSNLSHRRLIWSANKALRVGAASLRAVRMHPACVLIAFATTQLPNGQSSALSHRRAFTGLSRCTLLHRRNASIRM